MFPDGFRWGVSTASYQIEGSVTADGRGRSIWDTFAHTPGKVDGGDTGDVACDHYQRFGEDVRLMAELGVSAYRFSVAWPRIRPERSGRLNQRGLDFYRRLVDELLDHGIEPWPTLYHWDLPQWVEDAGGWPVRDTAAHFVDYVGDVHDALGDRVRQWITMGEPWCVAFLGYASGVHAPGRTDGSAAVRAAHHLLLGHGRAVQALGAADPGVDVGLALNLEAVRSASDDPADLDAARRVDGITGRFFLDPVLRGRYPADVIDDLDGVTDFSHVKDGDLEAISAPISFLGINYYRRDLVRAGKDGGMPSAWPGSEHVEVVEGTVPVTSMGWDIYPSGLAETLIRVSQDYADVVADLPLYVTENGAAFPDRAGVDGQFHDPDRIAYLEAHIQACREALGSGVGLKGYFVWSLLDNFEWAFGYSRRFGLVHVDYATQRRTPKSSARWYAGLIAANGA
jgi:beta-glucosidase